MSWFIDEVNLQMVETLIYRMNYTESIVNATLSLWPGGQNGASIIKA